MQVTYTGGILPSGSGVLENSSTARAAEIGFFTPSRERCVRECGRQRDACSAYADVPDAAPILPNLPVRPSMIDASHSTVPSKVRLEPYPSFMSALSTA